MSNITSEGLIGIAIVGIMTLIMVILALQKNLAKRITLRDIKALQNYKQALNKSIEEGKHIHLSLGQANILSSNNASAFIGLSVLNKVVKLGVRSDRPPLVTSGDGALSILSRDTMKAASQDAGALNHYNPQRATLSGVTPYSYILGTIPIIQNELVSSNNLIGFFGPESGYLGISAYQNSSYMLAGTESLPAQAIMIGTTQDTLIGEEIFSMPAYLFGRPVELASIKAQDIIRWFLILFIILSILVKTLIS